MLNQQRRRAHSGAVIVAGAATVLAGWCGAVVGPSHWVPEALVDSVVPNAAAHDAVVNVTPADGSTVDTFPRQIVITFSGVLKPDYNTVAISREDTGEILHQEEPRVFGQQVIIDVPDQVQPGPGSYKVGYRVTSSDGHPTPGQVTFNVAGGTQEQPQGDEASQPAAPAPDPSASQPASQPSDASNAPEVNANAEEASESNEENKLLRYGFLLALLPIAAFVAYLVKNDLSKKQRSLNERRDG